MRALESAATTDGIVHVRHDAVRDRIGPKTQLRVIDTVLSGTHEPGESHFDLLRVFADDPVLLNAHRTAAAAERHYHTHEFGDFLLIERRHAAYSLPSPNEPDTEPWSASGKWRTANPRQKRPRNA